MIRALKRVFAMDGWLAMLDLMISTRRTSLGDMPESIHPCVCWASLNGFTMATFIQFMVSVLKYNPVRCAIGHMDFGMRRPVPLHSDS